MKNIFLEATSQHQSSLLKKSRHQTLLNKDLKRTRNLQSNLSVKANVLNQNIGFIKNKMNSKIKIDTFNFQKYGFLEGKERYLEAGMSVTPEIKVSKRRVIEFFIYPIIKYLDEGLSVR